MSFVQRQTDTEKQNAWIELQQTSNRVRQTAIGFMSKATELHQSDDTDTTEEAEIIALRDALIADLRTILEI